MYCALSQEIQHSSMLLQKVSDKHANVGIFYRAMYAVMLSNQNSCKKCAALKKAIVNKMVNSR